MIIFKVLAFIFAIVVAAIGFLLMLQGIELLLMVISGAWNGVFERPDFLGATGTVRVLKTLEPDYFRHQMTDYTCLSLICVFFGVVVGSAVGSLAFRFQFKSIISFRR
jgi:hypothetical protein